MASLISRIEKNIRQTAAVSEQIFITRHAEQRMIERQVTMTQVLQCLRTGVFIEGPALDSYQQTGYKAVMQKLYAGQMVTVALKLIERGGGRIVVITVMSARVPH